MTTNTQMPALEISQDILDQFPDIAAYAFTADLSAVNGTDAQLEELNRQITIMVEQLEGGAVTQFPEIKAWREAYGTMGVKPSKFHSSVEQLIRRAAKNSLSSTGIPVVDLYNQISILCKAPMGAYDTDRLKNRPIFLRLAKPEADKFDPIGGNPEKFPLTETIAVYAQDEDILCWALNHRDAITSCLESSSHHALFVSEGVSEETQQNAQSAIQMLHASLTQLGAKCDAVISFKK